MATLHEVAAPPSDAATRSAVGRLRVERPGRRTLVLVAVVLALVVAGAAWFVQERRTASVADPSAAAERVATEQVGLLLRVAGGTGSRSDLEALKAGATASWRTRVASAGFSDGLAASGTRAAVRRSAVVDVEGTSARVLVVATSSDGGRAYLFRVALRRADSTWRVSALQAVR